MPDDRYWHALDTLVAGSEIVVDRPRGSAHPRFPAMIYPLDYGCLAGTRADDGSEMDCWIGSLPDRRLTALVFTADLVKRDFEGKLLLGCTPEEMQTVLASYADGPMAAMLLERPASCNR